MENGPILQTFTFVQKGERYIQFEAISLEDAEEQLENMTSAEIVELSYFKSRDSYWI